MELKIEIETSADLIKAIKNEVLVLTIFYECCRSRFQNFSGIN